MQNRILDEELAQGDVTEIIYPNFWRRIQAMVIDGVLCSVLYYSLMAVYVYYGQFFIFIVLGIVIFPLYKIVLEAVWGATLGKRWRRIQVVSLNNEFGKITNVQALLRSSLWLLQMATYSLTFYPMHLWLSGQVSVYEERASVLLFLLLSILLNICFSAYAFFNDRRQTGMDKIANVVCVAT